MTTKTDIGFTAVQFTRLQAITAELYDVWFPQWDGVHLADLPAAAQVAFNLERLVASVADRHRGQLNHDEYAQRKVDRINGRTTG